MSNQHLPTTTAPNQARPHNPFGPNNSPPTTQQAFGPDSIRYHIDGYMLSHRSQRHSQRTIVNYRDRLLKFCWFLEQQGYSTDITAITPNHIRHFLSYLSEEQGGRWDSTDPRSHRPLSQASIHTYAKTLKAFFRWAAREAGLPRNLFENVRMPALPNQWKVETFTDEEIAALFAAVERMGQPFIIERNRAMLALLLDSGLRASELLSLHVGDVNLQEGVFIITGKGRKTRTVITGNFARRQLWTYLSQFRFRMATPETSLFVTQHGTPLTYQGLRLMFRRLKSLSGIKRVSVRAHICRHTFASTAHRNGMRGVVLQEMLGHSSFEVTRRYYLDVSPDDLKREHSLYGPLDNMREDIRSGLMGSAVAGIGARTPSVHRPDLPSAEVLADEVSKGSYASVARHYGVSDTAIRKRLQKAKLLP